MGFQRRPCGVLAGPAAGREPEHPQRSEQAPPWPDPRPLSPPHVRVSLTSRGTTCSVGKAARLSSVLMDRYSHSSVSPPSCAPSSPSSRSCATIACSGVGVGWDLEWVGGRRPAALSHAHAGSCGAAKPHSRLAAAAAAGAGAPRAAPTRTRELPPGIAPGGKMSSRPAPRRRSRPCSVLHDGQMGGGGGGGAAAG